MGKIGKIEASVANIMIKHFEEGRNDEDRLSKMIGFRQDVYLKIIETYEPENISWVSARYKDDKDVKRYRELWKLPDDNESEDGKAGKVKDFKTWILKADKTKDGIIESTEYYDIALIKPPPHDSK